MVSQSIQAGKVRPKASAAALLRPMVAIVPQVKEQMLKEVGAESIAELREDVAQKLRLKEKMSLPQPYPR